MHQQGSLHREKQGTLSMTSPPKIAITLDTKNEQKQKQQWLLDLQTEGLVYEDET